MLPASLQIVADEAPGTGEVEVSLALTTSELVFNPTLLSLHGVCSSCQLGPTDVYFYHSAENKNPEYFEGNTVYHRSLCISQKMRRDQTTQPL